MRSGTVNLLIGLLAHENADIVIDVVEVVHELTDEDVGNEDEDEETEETAEEALKILIEGLVCCILSFPRTIVHCIFKARELYS